MMEALTDLVGTERGTCCWFETSQADKVPKVVHLRDVLPMLAVGKIDKKSLKAEATALLEG